MLHHRVVKPKDHSMCNTELLYSKH
uniref:Uncharacterized protein n=1 Tax=Anguilla anguilla TaxID=7936 RepID=A0A0E9TQK0_ANGAN